MRRYWKIGLLTLLIAVCLTGFFLYSSGASASYPEFVIQPEQEFSSMESKLTVKGEYSDGELERYAYASITSEGTDYTLLDDTLLQDGFTNPKMNELKEKHKNFMRGKEECLSCYDETDSELVYTDVDFRDNNLTYYFDVDVLLKETGERKTFELDLPNEKEQNHLDIPPEMQQIYLANDELKVIARLSMDDAETDVMTEEIHLFSIDINQEALVDDEIVLRPEKNEGAEGVDIATEAELVNEENLQEATHLVTRETIEKNDDEGNFETLFYVYHLDSQESEQLPLSEELGTENQLVPLQVSGDHLLFYEVDNQKLILYDYNLAEQKLATENQMELPEEITDEVDDIFVKLQDDYLLISNEWGFHPLQLPLFVFDLEEEEILYEGEIETDADNVDDYDLWIDDIQMQ